MNIEYRPVNVEEIAAFQRAQSRAFLLHPMEQDLENYRRLFEPKRSIAAFDGGEIVGTTGARSLEMTLPGGSLLPTAAVVDVSVQPTHRRRGILSEMMRRHFTECHERGDPISALWASESIIYGRFGYGMGIEHFAFEIDVDHSAFRKPMGNAGIVRMVDQERIKTHGPGVWDRLRQKQPGMVSRCRAGWEALLHDPDYRRAHGETKYFFAIYEWQGRVDGYVVYRISHNREYRNSNSTLVIRELISATNEAEERLWRYCLDIDLIARVEAHNRPRYDPLYWRLADPRRLIRRPIDAVWVRIVDLPIAMEARKYMLEGTLVFEVQDKLCDWNTGVWELDTMAHETVCKRSDRAPTIRFGAEELGAVFLGGVKPSTLARAGRVEELVYGALDQADRTFGTTLAPWSPEEW